MSELAALLADQPRYRADQVWRGLWERGARPGRHDRPAQILARPARGASCSPALQEVSRSVSSDGQTTKWLWQLADGARIESVLMHYQDRSTVCISSQSGCAMGCSFCATGQMGFGRHLSVGEIVEQVVSARREALPRRLGNVVFMGMGEPLANYDQGLGRCRADPRGPRHLGPPHHRVDGGRRPRDPPPGAARPLPVNLAVSLHAARDELRDRLVPLNRRYPLAVLGEACAEYLASKNRRLSLEWALIDRDQRHGPAMPPSWRPVRPPAGRAREPDPPEPHQRLRRPRDAAGRRRRLPRQAPRAWASTPRSATTGAPTSTQRVANWPPRNRATPARGAKLKSRGQHAVARQEPPPDALPGEHAALHQRCLVGALPVPWATPSSGVLAVWRASSPASGWPTRRRPATGVPSSVAVLNLLVLLDWFFAEPRFDRHRHQPDVRDRPARSAAAPDDTQLRAHLVQAAQRKVARYHVARGAPGPHAGPLAPSGGAATCLQGPNAPCSRREAAAWSVLTSLAGVLRAAPFTLHGTVPVRTLLQLMQKVERPPLDLLGRPADVLWRAPIFADLAQHSVEDQIIDITPFLHTYGHFRTTGHAGVGVP